MAKRVPAVSYMVFLICGLLLYLCGNPNTDYKSSCKVGQNCFELACPVVKFVAVKWQTTEQTITLKMADQGRSDFYVVFTLSLCALSL